MTNDEAIKTLNTLRESINGVFDYNCRNQCTAIDMAIKALEQQDKPKDFFMRYCESCKAHTVGKDINITTTDCVSRKEAIKAMFKLCGEGETLQENPWRDNPHIDAIIDALEDLPEWEG